MNTTRYDTIDDVVNTLADALDGTEFDLGAADEDGDR